MTMFPAHHHQNLSKQNRYSGYGAGCGGGSGDGGGRSYLEGGGGYLEYCSVSDQACLGSDLMAEDESRTESNNNEAGSSSREEEKDDRGWLQLSIGGRDTTAGRSSHHDHQQKLNQTAASRASGTGGRLFELDLLPPGGGGGGGSSSLQQGMIRPLNFASPPVLPPPTIFHVPEFRAPFTTTAPLFLQHQGTTTSSTTTFPYHHQETNYLAFRPTPGNISATAYSTPSSFSSLVAPPSSYFARPFQVHGGGGGGSGGGGMDVAGPSLDFRVVEPPRRPQSGVWFMLQASQNQVREPYLPQIPKSYIRIKDGRMTVRLLMKYLVNKLRLDDESEIEITCRGQQLLPFLTLQHVRDNVWKNTTTTTTSTRNDVVASLTLLPYSSAPATSTATTDHLMVLHYGRIA